MTQKEYKENIEKLIQEKEAIKEKLTKEQDKNYNYEKVLEDYYITKKRLDEEKQYNDFNCEKIRQQEELIEKYQKIIDKFTINC